MRPSGDHPRRSSVLRGKPSVPLIGAVTTLWRIVQHARLRPVTGMAINSPQTDSQIAEGVSCVRCPVMKWTLPVRLCLGVELGAVCLQRLDAASALVCVEKALRQYRASSLNAVLDAELGDDLHLQSEAPQHFLSAAT